MPIFGTTISPYLFFWQSSQEVEEEEADPEAGPLRHTRTGAGELTRIGWETWLGMAFSNLVAFFIMLTTAVTLHAAGKTDIQTAEQAAEALKPIAGEFASCCSASGSSAPVCSPCRCSRARPPMRSARPAAGEPGWSARSTSEAVLCRDRVAILLGVGIDFSPLDPIKALFWSAVINGVVVVPIMAGIMIVASRRELMGRYMATRWQRCWAGPRRR